MNDDIDNSIKSAEEHGSYLGNIRLDLDRKPLSCGFPTIEAHEYLLANRGNMVIVAGRTGSAKTAFSSQIALNVSLQGKKVLFFSLEMSKEAIAERMLSVISQVPIKKMKNPIFNSRIENAYKSLEGCKLKIIDTPNLSVNQLLSMVYDENRKERVSLVVIDYIGLLSSNKSDKRHLDIASIASDIKVKLADKLQIPVLVLAQMNQGIDSRLASAAYLKANGKDLDVRPMLSDMGESKGIADAADVVMFIRRPCLYDPEEPRELFKVYVCKNRSGITQDFNLEFSDELTYFIDKGNGV